MLLYQYTKPGKQATLKTTQETAANRPPSIGCFSRVRLMRTQPVREGCWRLGCYWIAPHTEGWILLFSSVGRAGPARGWDRSIGRTNTRISNCKINKLIDE